MYVVNTCNDFVFLIIVVCNVILYDVKKAMGKSKSDKVNEDGLLYSNTFILAWNI